MNRGTCLLNLIRILVHSPMSPPSLSLSMTTVMFLKHIYSIKNSKSISQQIIPGFTRVSQPASISENNSPPILQRQTRTCNVVIKHAYHQETIICTYRRISGDIKQPDFHTENKRQMIHTHTIFVGKKKLFYFPRQVCF